MPSGQASPDQELPAVPSHLTRILGLGFSVAVIFGGTVGVGILRLPGTIAAQMGSFWPIIAVWVVGGCYAMLGAISLAELGTAIPLAGGFYVYSKRAFGPGVGFAVGWADWLNNCAAIAYAGVAASEYLAALTPILASHQLAIAILLILLFCAMQWIGLRLSSSLQQITSSVTAITFLVLAAACLLHRAPQADHGAPVVSVLAQAGFLHILGPIVMALRAIVVTYDGWYQAIYFTEEDKDVSRNLPRAMIGGVLIVMGLYLLMNFAFLHVLSIPALSASTLPAADAAQIVFPGWSQQFVTVLSLLTLLSLINALLLGAPRILFAIGRDGLFKRAAVVGAGGTPRVALLLSAAAACVLILSGKFDDIIALSSILIAAMYCLNYIALIVLRIREPLMPRPFRAWGYPVSTLVVLTSSLLFLFAAAHEDPATTLRAAALLAVAGPVYWWMRWEQRSTKAA